jgi:hypothetical protein
MSSVVEVGPKTTNDVFKPTNVAATSIKAGAEATSHGRKTATRTVLKKCNPFEKLLETGFSLMTMMGFLQVGPQVQGVTDMG